MAPQGAAGGFLWDDEGAAGRHLRVEPEAAGGFEDEAVGADDVGVGDVGVLAVAMSKAIV